MLIIILLLLNYFHIFYMNKSSSSSSYSSLFFPFSCRHQGIPKESEIMDGFWNSRCLNDRIDLLYMIESFASGANASLVAKNRTKQPWVKIEHSHNFDRNFALFKGKIWLWLFYNLFCVMVLRFYTKNFKSFRPKMKAWHWFSQLKIKSKFRKIAVMPSFLV